MTEHDKFEAWYKTKWPQDTCWKWHDDEQRYTLFSGIQYLWESWQAALASAHLPVYETAPTASQGHIEVTADSVDWDRAQRAQQVAAIRSSSPLEAYARELCDKLETEYGCRSD